MSYIQFRPGTLTDDGCVHCEDRHDLLDVFRFWQCGEWLIIDLRLHAVPILRREPLERKCQ